MLSNKILQSTIAKRLGIIRKKRNLTMSGLAARSGVSKGTLSVLEDGSGNPTIFTLWSIADALNVPFNELISMAPQQVKPQIDADGVTLQPIDNTNKNLRIEAYHMTIQAKCHREATPHPSGVMEHVSVLRGHLLVGSLDAPKLIGAGEHFTFKADCPHIYSAPTDSVSAIITVQYPKDKQLSSEYTLVKSAPNTQEEWGQLLTLIHHHALQVANGLPMFRLLLRTGAEPEIVARNIEARLLTQQKNHHDTPTSLYFSPEKEQLCLYIFPKSKGYTDTLEKSPPETKDEHKILAYCKANNVTLDKAQLNFLKHFTRSGNLLCATLAAEALSTQGIPTLPHQINQFIEHQRGIKIKSKAIGEPLFVESIDSHTSYSLLRPGYARQHLVVGEMLLKHANQHRQVLAMGTDLGLSVLMLLDRIPDLDITAVEPNSTAFAYLQKNTENINIALQCSHFLDLNNKRKYPIITATGISYHLQTASFLQKAQTLLEPNGTLILAGEIIPSFSSEDEKNQALINHHLNYILDIIKMMTGDKSRDSSSHNALFIKPYLQELPNILFMAISNSVDTAVSCLKDLHKKIQTNEFKPTNNTITLDYYNLLNYELDVLIAGINNEINGKTSVANTFALAESSGLNLIEHQRVYATSGKTKTGGGLHVFVFQKSI